MGESVLEKVAPGGAMGSFTRRSEPGLTAAIIGGAARAFSACDEEEALHRELVSALAPALADVAALDIVDPEGRAQRVAALAAMAGDLPPPRSGAMVDAVLRSARSALVPRIAGPLAQDAGDAAGDLRSMAHVGIVSALVVPLPGRARVLGALTLGRGAGSPAFEDGDLDAAQAVAAAGGLALEALRLRVAEGEARRAAELSAQEAARLHVVASAFAGALSLRQVADVALATASAVLGADGGALYESSAERCLLVRAGGSLGGADASVPLEQGSPFGEAARRGRPRLRGAYALLPLQARGRNLGVLQLAFPPHGGIRPTDLDVALALAAGAAHAFERAALFRAGRRARSEARRAVRARDEFLSIAAHELRSPVAALRLRLGALRRQAVGDAGRALEQAAQQGERLVALVARLLDVSRISTGQLDLHPEEVDVAEVVRDAAGRARDELEQAGSRLAVRAEGPLPARLDAFRLDQVVTNLLTNAAHHARGSPVEVSVERRGALARIEVRDFGSGIAERDRERIFERFERGKGRGRAGGLGLGLWIVRRIVAAHGGAVHVESEPGRGAAFVVELPLPP